MDSTRERANLDGRFGFKRGDLPRPLGKRNVVGLVVVVVVLHADIDDEVNRL